VSCRTSGQDTIVVLLGDGGCDRSLLQCHQSPIGAPSPGQANQPWYPTVILPTTSPTGLAAKAGLLNGSVTETAARADPAATDVRKVRRETTMSATYQRCLPERLRTSDRLPGSDMITQQFNNY